MPSRSFPLQLATCALLACVDASSACVAARPAGETLPSIPTVASIPVAPMEARAEIAPPPPPRVAAARVDDAPQARPVEALAAMPERDSQGAEPPADAEQTPAPPAPPHVVLVDELPHRVLHAGHKDRADQPHLQSKRHGRQGRPYHALPVPHASELREALRASWPAVEECYSAGLAKHPDAGGDLELLFRTRSSGEIVEVVEDGDPRFADVDVTRCVLGVYRTARLPPGRVCTARETTFAYDMHFEARP
jgi:hypothetical protein